MKRFFLSSLTILYVIATAMSLLVLFQPTKAIAATPFNPNNLIDDFTFENTGSMSASTVDSWLNANFPNSCISSNNGFTTPDPQGWSDSQNQYLFGANTSAGKAITDAAALYHVNPQVILATLQKEQSIVGGGAGCHTNNPDPNWPFSNTPAANTTFTCTINGKSTTCTYACPTAFGGGCMNIAMSYGCPGYCSARDESFQLQLTLGSWILRFSEERAYGILTGYTGYETGDENFTYSGPMTAGYRQRVVGGQSIYYDGTYTTSDGTTVTIANGATASLYTYTPFISGNQSFDNIFQGAISDGYLGFGSVQSNDTFASHPNGTLIWENSRVYLISNGQKDYVSNADVFSSYGYRWMQVKAETTGDKNLPFGPSITNFAPGTLFRSDGSPVYVAEYENGILKKREVSYAAFISLGYSWADVMLVPPGEFPTDTYSSILFDAQHPSGTLVRLPNDSRVYLIDQGTLRYVPNPFVFESNDYSWSKILQATSLDASLPAGPDVQAAQGAIALSDGNIFVIDADTNGDFKRPVGPWECYANRAHYTSSDWLVYDLYMLPTRTGSNYTC